MAVEFDEPTVSTERARRLAAWHELQSSGSELFAPAHIKEARVFYGGRGIWVHQELTKGLGGYQSGVTVALLHTGSSYADDLSDDGVIYHYPKTKVPGRDLAEIEATRAAMWLKIPVFVVTYPSPNSAKRRVHLGWVQEYDDEQRWFLVSFGEQPVAPEPHLVEDTPFLGTSSKRHPKHLSKARPGQPHFKFHVFRRYSGRCAACDLAIQEILEAAHIIPDQENGTDDPRNGIVLCANHHRAFDRGLLRIHPESLDFRVDPAHSAEMLRVSRKDLTHLSKRPHPDALRWRWDWQEHKLQK